MTERGFLKNEVLTRLDERLRPKGFKLSKAACEFVQKTDFGWNKYQLVFLVRVSGWEIQLGLLTRFDVVENLYHQISNFEKKYHRGTATIVTPIEDLVNSSITKAKFELTNETQISDIVSGLLELFENIAMPFFEKYNNLEAIDEQLNSNVKDVSLTGYISKGTTSLITAKLMKREDYDELESAYQSYYEWFSDGFYLPRYLRLKDFLRSYP